MMFSVNKVDRVTENDISIVILQLKRNCQLNNYLYKVEEIFFFMLYEHHKKYHMKNYHIFSLKAEIIVERLRIGHTPLIYQHLFHRQPRSICTTCMSAIITLPHIPLHCSFHKEQRSIQLSSYKMEQIFSDHANYVKRLFTLFKIQYLTNPSFT